LVIAFHTASEEVSCSLVHSESRFDVEIYLPRDERDMNRMYKTYDGSHRNVENICHNKETQ